MVSFTGSLDAINVPKPETFHYIFVICGCLLSRRGPALPACGSVKQFGGKWLEQCIKARLPRFIAKYGRPDHPRTQALARECNTVRIGR